jgi:trk system potassium uptake protein TrkH
MNFHTFYKLVFYLSLFGIGILIYDFGYSQPGETQTFVNLYYFIVLVLGMLATTIRYLKKEKGLEFKVIVFDILSSIVIMSVLFLHFSGFDQSTLHTYLYDDLWVKLAILLTLVREFASLDINYNRTFLNPAQLFILSFIIIILGGTFLLMLPNATTNGISYVDALFTSTSAVCVTGLAVVDTSSAFTHFGTTLFYF